MQCSIPMERSMLSTLTLEWLLCYREKNNYIHGTFVCVTCVPLMVLCSWLCAHGLVLMSSCGTNGIIISLRPTLTLILALTPTLPLGTNGREQGLRPLVGHFHSESLALTTAHPLALMTWPLWLPALILRYSMQHIYTGMTVPPYPFTQLVIYCLHPSLIQLPAHISELTCCSLKPLLLYHFHFLRVIL